MNKTLYPNLLKTGGTDDELYGNLFSIYFIIRIIGE